MSLMTTTSKSESTAFRLPASPEDDSTGAASPAFRLDLLRSLRMHPVLALSTTIVSLILLLLYGSAMKPMYEAESLVYVQPEPIPLLGENLKPAFDPGKYDSLLQEQIQSMQRPDTIAAAIDKLPKSVWVEYGSSKEKATETILAKVKIARVSTSYQVSLMLKGSDARNITEVVNSITTAYLDRVHKDSQTDNDERAALLGGERQQVAKELRQDQEEQGALGASLGLANPDGEGDPYEAELTALREQLTQARSAHEAAAARLASLKGQTEGHGSALAAEADEAILGDAGLAALKSSVSQRRATLRGQMSGMTPDNPLRRRDQEELTDLDRSLLEMTTALRSKSEQDLQEKLRADLQRTGNLEARINLRLAQRTTAATNSTPKLQRAAELNGDVKRLLLRQAEIENATRSLELAANSPGAVRLNLAAQVPVSAEGNRKRLLLIASFPLALMLGMAAATIARQCDPRVYTGPDVVETLGFAPIAALPAYDEVSETVIEDEVLRLTGAVTTAYRVKDVRTLLLTTVSASTDITLLSRMLLEKLHQTGVGACSISVTDLLVPVHSANRIDGNKHRDNESKSLPLEQAGTQGFVNLKLALLQARSGLVLVKACQPFTCAETEYIARCADATILVVESGVTKQVELARTVESAHRLRMPSIGVVLQEVRKHYLTSSPRALFAAHSRASVVREPSIKEQSPALNKSEEMPSFSSGNRTDLPTLSQKDQATPSDRVNTTLVGASPTSRTSEQYQCAVSPPQPGQAHPLENTSTSCEEVLRAENFSDSTDGTDLYQQIPPSIAKKSESLEQMAKVQTVLLSNDALLGARQENAWPEAESTNAAQSPLAQQFVSNGVPKRPSASPFFAAVPEKHVALVRSGPLELLYDSDYSPTLHLQQREEATSTLQQHDSAGKGNALTRQWGLLSKL